MNSIAENLVNSLSGNVPKAILCVRNIKTLEQITSRDGAEERLRKKRANMKDTLDAAKDLQDAFMKATENALSGTVSSKARKNLLGQDQAYLAMEVQYNPSSIHMQTATGSQLDYSGGSIILTEAGGTITDWKDQPLPYLENADVLACAPQFREILLKLISE